MVTGFLGSGKTTLINRLLRASEAADAAVIVNEYGDIGIDNDLIEKIDGNVTLLKSGCVCCTVQDELSLTMHDLMLRRERGEIPRFRRMVVETTGLADPGPIAHRLLAEPSVATYYSLASVVTTVDCVNGAVTLERHAESVRQVALADRLVLTKADMAEPGARDSLVERLVAMNPNASIASTSDDQLDSGILASTLTGPMSDPANLSAWIGPDIHQHDDEAGHLTGSSIHTFSLVRETPMSWPQVSRLLALLGREDGDSLLRVKGIINVGDQSGPAVIHGVQRIIHLPRMLSEWPTDDRRTRIVFITDGLDRQRIADLFESACAA